MLVAVILAAVMPGAGICVAVMLGACILWCHDAWCCDFAGAIMLGAVSRWCCDA
jgi:hypothetical protein